MSRHFAYLRYVIRHKWFVLLAAVQVKASLWRAIIHDWSKFRPSEWFAYASTFYAPDGTKQYVENEGFNRAWLLHQHRNPHHWQYWLLRQDNPETERFVLQEWGQVEGGTRLMDLQTNNACPIPALDLLNEPDNPGAYDCVRVCRRLANQQASLLVMRMPERFAREMVADWMGAGRAITGRWEAISWYERNRDKIVLHAETRRFVEALLMEAAG